MDTGSPSNFPLIHKAPSKLHIDFGERARMQRKQEGPKLHCISGLSGLSGRHLPKGRGLRTYNGYLTCIEAVSVSQSLGLGV